MIVTLIECTDTTMNLILFCLLLYASWFVLYIYLLVNYVKIFKNKNATVILESGILDGNQI